jgi:GT2 family glycosyltransferase
MRIEYEPIAGVGRAKNRGWRVATGEFINFIDDDCYVAPDHIDRAIALFRTPEIGYGGGRVTLFDPADYPITIQLSDKLTIIQPYSYVGDGFILGANMVFRRTVLEQVDGFDPNLGPGNKYVSDDPDIQARASFAGWSGIYDPALTIAHHHGRDAVAARKLLRIYCISMGAYYAKFLLRSDSRPIFAKHIYWLVRSGRLPLRLLLYRAEGVAGYLMSRAVARIKRSTTRFSSAIWIAR